ncbi:hypothetical protein SUGI_0670300 [Cryptomeria japonica]|nr:hypothetical protein SUGI_0670300 [Cryptomeria japonica]
MHGRLVSAGPVFPFGQGCPAQGRPVVLGSLGCQFKFFKYLSFSLEKGHLIERGKFVAQYSHEALSSDANPVMPQVT